MANAVIAQDGKPRDLYELPANRFIADFIGDANIVAGTLVRRDDKAARVNIGGLDIDLPHRDQAARSNSWCARISSRSSRLRWASFVGTIAKATYVGPRIEYTLTTAAGELFVVSTDVARPLAVGAAVAIGISTEGAAVIPRT